jgi:membrane protein YqaA with SNARE-associated domain
MAIKRYWSSKWWAETIKPNAQRIAGHPRAEGFVFLLEFAGLTIFPIPVALIMVALITAAPNKWLRFAISATIGSILGSIVLYVIGMAFFQSIGERLIDLYGAQERWSGITEKFEGQWGTGFVLFAGSTTGFVRLASLGAGFTGMNLLLFLSLMTISRTLRFIAECYTIKYLGERVQSSPSHYFKYATATIIGLIVITMIVISFLN